MAVLAYKVGFRKPTLLLPAAIRFSLMSVISPATVGQLADVPKMRVKSLSMATT